MGSVFWSHHDKSMKDDTKSPLSVNKRNIGLNHASLGRCQESGWIFRHLAHKRSFWVTWAGCSSFANNLTLQWNVFRMSLYLTYHWVVIILFVCHCMRVITKSSCFYSYVTVFALSLCCHVFVPTPLSVITGSSYHWWIAVMTVHGSTYDLDLACDLVAYLGYHSYIMHNSTPYERTP